jgi:hypothetical protein
MAYGGEGTIAATTADLWLEDNIIDVYSSNNAFLAQLLETSKEPGMDKLFKIGTPGEGGSFKIPLFGRVSSTAGGVTRANQVNPIAPAINDDVTSAKYNWAHYQGVCYHNYEDMTKNSGKAGMADLAEAYINGVIAKLNDAVGNDMFAGTIDSGSKVLSVNYAVDNSGLVGGIDQTDSVNNAFWQGQQDTVSEVFQTFTFDRVRDLCYNDTSVSTGIRRPRPDMAMMYPDLYSALRQELKQSQRTDATKTMLVGGAEYLEYDSCRCFMNSRQVAGTVLLINSSTWYYRYATKAPHPQTPGWFPVSQMPAVFQRGFNWFLGLGCSAPKYNGVLKNKTAS